jgi:hypothetical protein
MGARAENHQDSAVKGTPRVGSTVAMRSTTSQGIAVATPFRLVWLAQVLRLF